MAGPSEGRAASSPDIDLDTGVILVRRTVVEHLVGQGANSWYSFKEPKSGHGRSVDVGEATIARLKAHRKTQAAARLASGSDWNDLDLVISTPIGTPQRLSTTSGRFRVAATKAGLSGVRFHDLRHCSCNHPAKRRHVASRGL